MDSIKIAQWGGRHITYMPLFLADRLGLFAAQGLNVTIYGAGNDDEIFTEVAQGRAHFGIGDPAFVALGRAQGFDTRVIATIVGSACSWGLTHHTEIKPFTQISDFVGLRVGTIPRPSTMYTLLKALRVRQPRLLKSMQVVETEIGQQAYLLASDQVDMILEIEPSVSSAMKQGLRLVCDMNDFFPELMFTGLMASAATINASPAVVGKVVKALQQALMICHTQPEMAVSIGCALFPTISRDVMSEAVQRMLAAKAWPEQAVISPAAWNNALKLRQDAGELGDLPPFEEVVDQRFAYAALAETQ
ncbi:MAG: ABC transporter substrate-binding protein [Alphaproteobacteria bacterium]|nr:ABC transporter substrate-binding protein [Alphaproteobacteria bacterium]